MGEREGGRVKGKRVGEKQRGKNKEEEAEREVNVEVGWKKPEKVRERERGMR